MKRPATPPPLASSSTGKDTSLLSKALRDLSGASNLKDERVGPYLATWALCCPLARRQFNNAVQYMNFATSTHTTGEACKSAVEVYTASLLLPNAMCALVVNMRAPKASWRTLLEFYTLLTLEYHRTVPGGPYYRPICTERDFQARWKELATCRLPSPTILTNNMASKELIQEVTRHVSCLVVRSSADLGKRSSVDLGSPIGR